MARAASRSLRKQKKRPFGRSRLLLKHHPPGRFCWLSHFSFIRSIKLRLGSRVLDLLSTPGRSFDLRSETRTPPNMTKNPRTPIIGSRVATPVTTTAIPRIAIRIPITMARKSGLVEDPLTVATKSASWRYKLRSISSRSRCSCSESGIAPPLTPLHCMRTGLTRLGMWLRGRCTCEMSSRL